MKIFDAGEIFSMAVQIEENGENFYRHAMEITDNAVMKKLFGYLADEEAEHKATFRQMCDGNCQHEPVESFPGEYQQYMQAYTSRVIFDEKALDEEIARVKDGISALDFAIRRELDSILFYHEMKKFVTGKDAEQIDKIIEEERRHFVKLVDLNQSNN